MLDLDAPEYFKTKDRDFQFYIKESAYFQKELGLLGWNIYYDHVKKEGEKSLAWTNCDEAGMVGTICLNVDWNLTKPTEDELSIVAFHEMCEVLFWKLGEQAEKGVSRELCNTERHAIIRTLENTLWGYLVAKKAKKAKKSKKAKPIEVIKKGKKGKK